MKKHIRWLRSELDDWVTDGLIGSEQANAIRKRYPEPEAGLPWGAIIFSGMGAIIVGLGVILLFAYNWQAMPKMAKLAVIFAALIAAHAGGIRLFLGDRYRAVGEALCLLGTMFFGAGIWLIAQIYHIQEHFPNGLLFWACGALLLAWALPSVTQGMVATVLFTIWACVEAEQFYAPMHLAPFIILVLLGGLAWRERSRALLVFVLPAFAATVLVNVGVIEEDLIAGSVLALAVLYIAVARLVTCYGKFVEFAAVFGFFGWAGYLVVLYILTFSDVVHHVLGDVWPTNKPVALTYWLVLLAASLGGWTALAVRRLLAGRDGGVALDPLLPPLTLIFYVVSPLVLTDGGEWQSAAVFNLVFLAHATTLMARGCRSGELRPTIFGSLMLGALTFARYFDLFHSLFARGVVFVIVGGIVFAEGIVYTRARRRQLTEGSK